MKKGQAALEFMSTYSWAIAIIIIVLAAVVYFGFFDTSVFMDPYCVVNKQWVCEDFNVYENLVLVQVRNNFGEDMVVTNMTILDTETSTSVTCNQLRTIPKGGNQTFACGFSSNVLDKKAKKTVAISFGYHKEGSGFEYVVRGSAYGRPHDTVVCGSPILPSASSCGGVGCAGADYGHLNCGAVLCCG